MIVRKLRESRLTRAKLNLLSWSGRAEHSQSPIHRNVMVRMDPDARIRASLFPPKNGVEDRLFESPLLAATFVTGLSLEHGAEIDHA